MIRGFYTAASGSIANEARLATLMNNIANVQTTGYKQDRIANAGFYEMLLSRLSDSAVDPNTGEALGTLATGTGVGAPTIDFSQGALVDTGRPLDVALTGPGFLVVQTREGTRYTRFGSLRSDANGVLVQPDGNPVLGADGFIRVGQGTFRIDDQGNVFADDRPVGRLQLVEIAPEFVEKAGENYYQAKDATAVQPARQTAVNQGFLESSNVDVTRSTVDLMEIIRSYNATQEAVKLQDQVLGQAVNELGKLV